MRTYLFLPLMVLLTACSAPPELQPPSPDLPSAWQSPADTGEQSPDWLVGLNDPALVELVDEAMLRNPSLEAVRQQWLAAQQRAEITGAARYPQLSLELSSRRQEGSPRSESMEQGSGWTLDVWGKLSADQREAELSRAAAEAAYVEQREALAASLARNWFALQEARMLLMLYTQRRDNLQQNLDIIESGYRQGLNEALDLYLARNNLHAEAARVEQQQQTLSELQRELERQLGRYPAAQLTNDALLPLNDEVIVAGQPAEILTRRPDLQQQWLQLLASDAALAAAHRDRFPAFNLSAAYGGSSDALSDLLSGGNLAWSLGASLVQSLFDAGRKAAVQDQALAVRREQEQRWLDALFSALTEVENALSSRQSLKARYALYLKAEQNALSAETLAFEQYRNGLENYTTVLEAQRRSLDAQTSVINLRRQLLDNRIELYRALGGRFASTAKSAPLQQAKESDTP
ncbi:efflux transporter outer membrane subunit [Marinobacterium sediminicola]|uniref:Efflux transporter, outer membrane factor (OMF) lipoprotein, NodT family n=1 Tax=Marinobacterium sediminicola TaxID=518898 RepID=A0ABY1S111_9GAMM|nr:efflux transporter outer membrane subunit [Marinobacterium sediminicola]ULG69810.1 efflux transporter outer membrane subunit [Marinobacterium sediminicola]SMR75376.1 efflux transporter, outer membrane factor (OMF) lipoprotein, NodT family [Marinobacterium sediminicola]